MISNRFQNDGQSIADLTHEQLKYKNQLENKINTNHYKFQNNLCNLCSSDFFEILSEKDRYGLFMPVVICKKCGLVQTNPRMLESNYKEFYNYEYRKIYSSNKDIDSFFNEEYQQGKKIYELLENVLKKTISDMTIVEIGTGAGGILKYFQDNGNIVFGVDYGEEYLEYGKKNGLNLSVGSVESIPSSIKPDIVIYSHVLEHVFDPTKELTNIRKLLKRNSILFIEVPGILNIHRSYFDFLRYLQNAHLNHFSLESLTNFLHKTGFGIIYGNESCRAICKLQNENDKFVNVYGKTKQYLLNLEKNNSSKFNIIKLKLFIYSGIIRILKKTNMIHVVQKILYSIENKKKSN